jgi:hypothetical protein
MSKVQYLYKSYIESGYIDCEIIPNIYENLYKIRYFDPITKEIKYKLVCKSELKFPEYSEYIM